MKNDDMTIDEKTRISLYAVAACVPVLIGGIVWLTAIDAKASAASKDLDSSRKILETFESKLESIDNRLSRIEGKLEK